MREIKYFACETFKKLQLGKQRKMWRMTLRWRPDVIGSGSRWFKVDALGASDVEVSCVCVCVCEREREREREREWNTCGHQDV